MIKSFQERAKELKALNHVKTFTKKVYLIIFRIQLFFTKKLRINTIKRPNPINANEKVNRKDNPITSVLILDEIFWTISDELEGLCNAK